MKRIRITRATVADRRAVGVGEVLDLHDAEAALLVAMRKAEEIPVAEVVKAASGRNLSAAQVPGQAGENPRPLPGLTTENAVGLVRRIKRRTSKNALNLEP